MNTQNQIKRTLLGSGGIVYVRELLEGEAVGHRTALAKQVCEQFGFFDGRGRAQLSGCVKALRELEAGAHFELPAPCTRTGRGSPRRLEQAVAPAVEVPDEVGAVRGLELVLVSGPEHRQVWNELMSREHPQGAGPLVGRQLRYLIGSQHGWLGGLGFASAALQLADRDRWMGWNKETRQAHLDKVVGMARFLIRPSVRCHNLASKVLSLSLAAMAEDFERHYGYRPWLVESFVELRSYSGSCYRAANWIAVGVTKGRGRQDRDQRCALPRKAIYVYPLVTDVRRRVGLSADAGLGALAVTQGLDSEHWAQHEFGGAPVGDRRVSERLVKVAAAQAQVPDRAFSGVAKGDWPAVKAYYRMIDQPEESQLSMANIVAPHRARTARRMQGQKTVLCVQDGSDLNYNGLAQCEGLGELGTNQTGASSRGLHLHSTLALATNGLPLGVLGAQCIARGKAPEDKRHTGAVAREEKKSFVWIEHHRDLVELAAQMPATRLIDVCDREADFFALFDEQRQDPRVELLVRAKHNRKLKEQPFKLFAAVREQPEQSRICVNVPHRSARAKRSKQKARAKRPARMAQMAVRAMRFALRSVEHRDKDALDIWVVHALEDNPPAGEKPIEWFLLTTIAITSPGDAEQCLRWYCLRWRIEDWHRVLKSGCRIEDLRHETAQRLSRAIAINLVIAWRIMLMTLLGRETPQLPAEVLFSDIELRTLSAYAKKKGLKPPALVEEAVRLVAKIGGYLDRTNDPPPGHQLLWQGYTEFQFMCLGFALLEDPESVQLPFVGKRQP